MFKQFLCCATLLCAAGFSQAGIIVQNLNVERQDTDFNQLLTFELFDSQGNTRQLQSVFIELYARSSGSIKVENMSSNNARNITATLSTDINLWLPDNSQSLVAAPVITRTDLLTKYDGTLDYDGTSGVEFLNLATNDYASILMTDLTNLALFIGTGFDTLLFDALATSAVTGGGNLSTLITTRASADISITYYYVSESSSLALLVMAMGFIAVRTRQR